MVATSDRSAVTMIGTQEDELQIFASGQRYRIEQVKVRMILRILLLTKILIIIRVLRRHQTLICQTLSA